MSRFRTVAALAGLPIVLSLGACVATPPPAPSFVALPGANKSYGTFVSEDTTCRQIALGRSGYAPGRGANSAATGAVVGTALGAGAGALLGAAAGNAGIGAAAGAGTGLLAGTAVGADNGALAEGGVQVNYDAAYAQCMAAYGNKVPPPGQIAAYPADGAYASYGYPAYADLYGPGWGWGWGWGGYGWGGFYPGLYGLGFYGGGYYGRGYYGRGYYGRGYYGHGGYGHGGYGGGYGHGGYGGGWHGGGGGGYHR